MESKIIDLSLSIYHNAPTFKNDPECSVVVHNTIDSTGYNITQISMSTHQGTHLDAPYHFFDNGMTVDQIPLETVIGKAVKINLTQKKPKDPITVDDLLPYEACIQKGSRIILHTGWDKIFPCKEYFSDFAYITMELADWLAGKEIALLGMDMPTPNPKDWIYVHHALLGQGIIVVEGLANLGKITQDDFLFIAVPLRITGRDGSPVRAVALEEM